MIRKTVILNIVLQTAGVLCFIAVSNTLAVAWIKGVLLVLFAAGSGFIVFKSFPGYQMKSSLVFSLMSALTFVIVYQSIGFIFYPGIVKDVSPFSRYHFYLSSIVFCIFFVFYSLCCTCLLIKK